MLTSDKKSTAPGETSNILNNYRSVTYNFTLAAISPTDLKSPQNYRNSKLKYVVAASKGKGSNAISTDVVPIKVSLGSTAKDDDGNDMSMFDTEKGIKTVEGFNQNSAGALDLFIDNVEIESIITPNEQTGAAVSTRVKFEIYEPLSANGFIEALHVSAIAAGWTGYLGASYLLKIEFLGYLDSITDPVAESVIIPATKYIPIKFTGSEMELTEQGTRYRCSAIPYNEVAHGNANKIYTDMSFSGDTVKQVLENLFENLNKSAKSREQKEKTEDSSKSADNYEIYFPEIPAADQPLKIDKEATVNKIAQALINDKLRSNNIYKFPPIESSPNATPVGGGRGSANDPRRSDAPDIATQQKTAQVQFSKGANITEIIEAVIRDSQYLKGILKDVEKAKDAAGMIDYFQILINMIPGDMDLTTNQQKFTYQYIVCPYKVHFSKLPGQEKSQFSAKNMSSLIKRTYNYLYQGKNIDVLGFKLNFNNLFFQAAVPKMGNVDQSGTANAAGAANTPEIKMAPGAGKNAQKNVNDVVPTIGDTNAVSSNGKGQQSQADPYSKIAELAHNAILESVNLLTGEIEILGDPFYLSTSGMGNYLPKNKDGAITTDGEATINTGPVVARINFRNPVDIDPQTGLVRFSELTPFSGVYQVLRCRNSFRDGVFKQTLNIMRYNGQIDETPTLKETKAIQPIEGNKPGEQQVIDAAPKSVNKFGAKQNDFNIGALLGKGFPEIGIAKASFKSVTGLLPAGNLFDSATAGISVGLNAFAGANSLLKGIPAGVDALTKLAGTNLDPAASLAQLGNAAKSFLPGNPASELNANVVSSLANSSIADSLGATTIASVSAMGAASADLVKNIGDKVGNLTASLANGTSGGLTPAQRAAVIEDARLNGIPVAQALRNAEVFGYNLPGSAASPANLASKLGIDASQISGLTGKLDSKVLTEIENIAKSVPTNVSLDKIKETGIIMAGITKENIANLPAMPTKLKAPSPDLPASSSASSLTPAQRTAVIEDATAKGIPVEQALRNASMFGVNTLNLTDKAKEIALASTPQLLTGTLGAGAGLLGSADLLTGKVSTIQKSLGGLIPGTGSIENAISSVQQAFGNPGSGVTQLGDLGKSVVSKFGSLTAAAAGPLDRLMSNSVNTLNDPNAAPYTGIDPIVRRRLGLPPIEEA
jgi:hypothetical protein